MDLPVSLELVDAQEERFARAFAASDISQARDLYHPDVVYQSPTTRLFGGARDADDARLRSVYVVLYRYVEGLVARQELYYDPGAPPELLGAVASRSKL